MLNFFALVALLGLSSWCLAMAGWLFLVVPLVCLWFVIVVFPDHTQILFLLTESNVTLISHCNFTPFGKELSIG